MHVHEALDQLADIRRTLTRAETFRGYRPEALAAAGLVGFAAGAFQGRVVAPGDPLGFLLYWVLVAGAAGLVGASATLAAYCWWDEADARRKTRQVAGQFAPCLAAGMLVAAAVWRAPADLQRSLMPLLPGLWALLFSLGLFACRPFFPRALGWVALGFLLAGAAMLLEPTDDLGRAGWRLGVAFGVGQWLLALVLQLNLTRLDREERDA